MHAEARDWVADHLPDRISRVIELGSLDVNGTIRDLFDCDYVGVDLVSGSNVDVVGDAATVDLPPADVVVCCEVLEHSPVPKRIVANAFRLVNPGGRLILTCAGGGRTPHGQHGALRPVEGEHYANIHADRLPFWFAAAGFVDSVVERGRGGGDIYAVAYKGVV